MWARKSDCCRIAESHQRTHAILFLLEPQVSYIFCRLTTKKEEMHKAQSSTIVIRVLSEWVKKVNHLLKVLQLKKYKKSKPTNMVGVEIKIRDAA